MAEKSAMNPPVPLSCGELEPVGWSTAPPIGVGWSKEPPPVTPTLPPAVPTPPP